MAESAFKYCTIKNGKFIINKYASDKKCAIDKENGTLRPQYDERSVNLIRKTGDSGGVVVSGSIAHLPIASTKTLIDQPYASSFVNVNPYNAVSYTHLTLPTKA